MILQERFKESKYKNEAVKKIITAFVETMPQLTEKKIGHLFKGVALELARTFPEDQKVIYLLFAPIEKMRKKERQPVKLTQAKVQQEGVEIVVDQACEDCGDDVLTIKTQSKNKKNVLIVPAATTQRTLPASAYGDVDGQHEKMNELTKLNNQGDVISKTKATPMEIIEVKSPSYISNQIGKNLGVSAGEAYQAAMESTNAGLEIDKDNPDVSAALVKEYTKKVKEKAKTKYNMWNDATLWTDVVEVVGADSDKLWDFIVDNVEQYDLGDNETSLVVLAKVIFSEIELRRRGKKS